MINKKLNNNLQLTITKRAFNKLEQIKTELLDITGVNLSKSQVIEYLINKYELQDIKVNNNIVKERYEKERDTYTKKVLRLKDALNVSYKTLSEKINIPINSLKTYGTGKQTPSEKNKIKIDNALKYYGIK